MLNSDWNVRPRAAPLGDRVSEVLLTTLAVAASLGLLYAALALGFALVYGITGESNLAYGDIIVLALIMSAVVAAATGQPTLAVLSAIGVTTLGFVVLSTVVIGPLRGSGSALTPIIATIGASLIVRNIALTPFGADDRGYPAILGDGRLVVGTTSLDAPVLAAGAFLAVVGVAAASIYRRRWGRAVAAVRESRVGARLTGIPVARVVLLVYAVGGALAGIAGILLAAHTRGVGAELGFRLTLIAFSASILGGGTLRGAVAGGMALGVIAAVAQLLIGSTWADASIYLALIAVMLARPHGLSRQPSVSRT